MKYVLGLVALVAACAPVAHAAPVACAAECVILASEGGYAPPVLVIASGDTVTWRSVDIGHPTSDSISNTQRCFMVPVGPDQDGRVRFSITGGAVRATTLPNGGTKTCTSATVLPAGGAVLPFICSVHPQMRGALVIQG